MIDCNNNDSQTFKNLQAAGINPCKYGCRSEEDRRQYLGLPGNYNAYNSENASDSYAAAWYQASVQYTVTLSGRYTYHHGRFQRTVGTVECNQKECVYYTVDGEEQKLADLNLTGAKGVASGEITLDEEKEVTITVKKVSGNEAIVNWITYAASRWKEIQQC